MPSETRARIWFAYEFALFASQRPRLEEALVGFPSQMRPGQCQNYRAGICAFSLVLSRSLLFVECPSLSLICTQRFYLGIMFWQAFLHSQLC